MYTRTIAEMTVVGASMEYWRLQDAMEALTQEQYEGEVGERLMARQTACHQRVADLTGDERWNEGRPVTVGGGGR